MLAIVALIIAIIFISVKLYISPPTKWCRSHRCLVGKTVMITGANSGIGYEAALDFAKRGAKVILACRDWKKAQEACCKIIETTNNPNICVKIVDFTSFESVRSFAKEINETEDRLDILVNNAGISFADNTKTKDGHDLTLQVNYYSHFLLTQLLIELMQKSEEPSRIVNVSSVTAALAVFFDINALDKFPGNSAAYINSKLCHILFTKELAKRLKNTKVTTYSVHPGCIQTHICKNAKGFAYMTSQLMFALFFKPLQDGAQTIVYCSVEKNIEQFSGQHFDNCRRVSDYMTARNPKLPGKLWKLTEQIVQEKNEKTF